MFKAEKFVKLIGITIMGFAFLANPWVIEYFFSPDRQLDFAWKYLVILFFDLIIFSAGFICYHFSRTKAKEILLLIFSSLLSLIIAGLAVFSYFKVAAPPAFFYVLDDVLLWKVNPNFLSQGFMEENLDFNNLPDNSVYVIGDSFTFGAYVSYEEAFPTIVDDKIPAYNFINLGVSGYDIYQYYLMADKYTSIKKPQALLVNIYVGNDFFTYEEYREDIMEVFDKLGSLGKNDSKVKTPHQFIYSKFHDFLFGLKWNGESYSKQYYPELIKNESILLKKYYGDYEQTLMTDSLFWLEKIIDFSSYKDIEVAIVLHPAIYQIYPEVFDLYLRKYGDDIDNFEIFKIQRLVRELLDKKNVNYIDLAPAFMEAGKKEKLYRDLDNHYSEAGHALAAEVIIAKLKEMNFLNININE